MNGTIGSDDGKKKSRSERPKEPWKGEYAKSILYAGLDAIITSFSLISSICASRISSVDVLVLGFANLVADGISMGWSLIPFTNNDSVTFVGACVLSAIALPLLGIAKAKIAGQNYAFSVAVNLFNGAIAAAAEYAVGWTLTNVAGLEA
ncbi:uncharacterized protein [Malus domestica]|uniref:uncharacterized protein n=1 Tax=Malus domestica TaxID=3750 RepID=UPI0039755724